jgi:hypothetical protein
VIDKFVASLAEALAGVKGGSTVLIGGFGPFECGPGREDRPHPAEFGLEPATPAEAREMLKV